MRKVVVPGAALVLLAGCVADPSGAGRAVYYIPPSARAPSWSPPAAVYYAPAPADPANYVVRSVPSAVSAPAARDVVPVNAPLPGVPAGDDCGSWRLCNLPGWRYEN
jgi:hypothetical protein